MTVANIQQKRTSAGSSNGVGGKLSPKTAIRKISMHPNKSSRGHRVVLAALKEKANKDSAQVRNELDCNPAERDNGHLGLGRVPPDASRCALRDEDEDSFPALAGLGRVEEEDFSLHFCSHQPQGNSSPEVCERQGSHTDLRPQQASQHLGRSPGTMEFPSPRPKTPIQRRSPEYSEQAEESRRSSFGASPRQLAPSEAPHISPAVTIPDQSSWNETETQEPASEWWSSPRSQEDGRLSANSSPQGCARGLRNLGNTCYINAVLQMLNSLESFKSDLESACSEVSAPTSENNVLFTLQAVLKQLYCNSSRAPVNPNQLRRVFANRFLEYSQEDAHEFLVDLLDQVQNEVRAALKPTVGGGDDTISRDNQQACPIEKNFGCTVRNTLQCTQCSKTSHVEEPFLHFTLGMPESSAESSRERQPDNQDLSSLLDLSFKENTVEYRCEKCEATTATACARFSSLPRLLILHLKRLHLGCKSSAPIKFNEELDLSKWCCSKPDPLDNRMVTTKYRLHAMISHLGGSGESGHFIADAFNPNTKTWLRCDDDAVTAISSEHVFSATKEMEGYIFVYMKDSPL